MNRSSSLFSSIVLLSAADLATAQCVVQELHPNPSTLRFGSKILRAGDIAAIARYPEGLATGGEIHFIERTGNTWQFNGLVDTGFDPAMLMKSEEGMGFNGQTLAAAGRTFSGTDEFYVNVWEKVGSTFQYVQTLAEPYSPAKSYFGYQLDLDGDTLAVPCISATVSGITNVGNVSIFEKQAGTWVPVQQVIPSDPSVGIYVNQFFGVRIALDGDVLVVGTPDYVADDNRGALYVHRRGPQGFALTQTIQHPEPGHGWWFGYQIELEDGLLAVRTLGDDVHDPERVYLYEDVNGSFVFRQQLICDEPHTYLGTSMAIDGDRIALSAEEWNGTYSTSVRLLERVGGHFVETDVLRSPDTNLTLAFGVGLALDGETLLIGDTYDDTFGTNAGSVSVARISDTPYGVGCVGTGSFRPRLGFIGCPIYGTKMGIDVDGALGGSYALVFIGAGAANVPMGHGCSLLAAPLFQTTIGPLPLTGVGPGQGECNIGFLVPAGLPSATLHLQAFVADPGVPLGFSNTNATKLVIE